MKRFSRLDLLIAVGQNFVVAAEVNAGRIVGGSGAGDDDIRSAVDGQRVVGQVDDAAHHGALGAAGEADFVGDDCTVDGFEVARDVVLESLGQQGGAGQ